MTTSTSTSIIIIIINIGKEEVWRVVHFALAESQLASLERASRLLYSGPLVTSDARAEAGGIIRIFIYHPSSVYSSFSKLYRLEFQDCCRLQNWSGCWNWFRRRWRYLKYMGSRAFNLQHINNKIRQLHKQRGEGESESCLLRIIIDGRQNTLNWSTPS